MKALPMTDDWKTLYKRALWKLRLADPGQFKLVLAAHMGAALALGIAVYVYVRPSQGSMLLLMPIMFIMVTDMLSTQRKWFQGLLLSGLFTATGLFFCANLFNAKFLLLLFLFVFLFAFFSIPGYRGPFSTVLWIALLSASTSGGFGWHYGVNLVLTVVLSLLIVVALYVPFSNPYRSCIKSCLVLYADEITQAYLHLVRYPGAPSHTGVTYNEMMANFSAVSLKAGLLIHERQYLLESERLFAECAAALHRNLRGLATDLSFLHGYELQRETLVQAAPSTERVLSDFRRRLEGLSEAMRRGVTLSGGTEADLYRAWHREAEAALENREVLGMDCTRFMYGLNCLDEDLGRMEELLANPLFAEWWRGNSLEQARQMVTS